MRTGQPIIARPAWYDRNPVSRTNDCEEYYAPHETTIRWTYTCPAGKKAMVEMLRCSIERTTAATTTLFAMAGVLFTPKGGAPYTIIEAYIDETHPDVGAKESVIAGATLVMAPGDLLEGYTLDDSTGGQCYYSLAYKITEFDA